jgi:hypothetical protein
MASHSYLEMGLGSFSENFERIYHVTRSNIRSFNIIMEVADCNETGCRCIKQTSDICIVII